jgi:hypothetical protein
VDGPSFLTDAQLAAVLGATGLFLTAAGKLLLVILRAWQAERAADRVEKQADRIDRKEDRSEDRKVAREATAALTKLEARFDGFERAIVRSEDRAERISGVYDVSPQEEQPAPAVRVRTGRTPATGSAVDRPWDPKGR